MPVRENYSRKRVAILDVIKSTKVHPTAEWVYTTLKPNYKDLSLGTVYRNIKKFCDEGVIKSVGVLGAQEHFDGNTRPHSHFFCTKCNCVLDIEKDFFSDDAKSSLCEEYGFEIMEEELMFKGLCKDCMSKNM